MALKESHPVGLCSCHCYLENIMSKTTTTPSRLSLGEILVSEGWITAEQLEHATLNQAEAKDYRPIGDICVEKNWISRQELKTILKEHRVSLRIGDLLVHLGLVTEEQIEHAMADQKSSGKRLGQVLIDKGFISEDTLASALSVQLGILKIAPDTRLVDRSLLRLFNVAFLKKYVVLPLTKDGKTMTLLMADPLDSETIRQVSLITQCTVEPAIATHTALMRAIQQCTEPQMTSSVEVANAYPTLTINDKPLLGSGEQNATSILDYCQGK